MTLVVAAVCVGCSHAATTATYDARIVPHSQSLPPGVYLGPPARAEWLLDHTGAGRTLVLRVAGGGCPGRFDHATVTETTTAVALVAWDVAIRASGQNACTLDLSTHAYTIVLRHRLGGRSLAGACSPTDGSSDGRVCMALEQARLRGTP